MEPNSPSRDKLSKARSHGKTGKLCALVGIAIIVLLIGAGAYHLLNGFSRSDRVLGSPYFSVVVDCGSSGTRVNVYEWEMRPLMHFPVLLHSYPDNSTKGKNCIYHCIQTEPSLDKLLGNSSGIRASLDPLIRWAEGVVPTERLQQTPLLVLATAGLRSLPSKDAEWILEEVQRVIKDHRFAYNTSWLRALTGKQEAYFGWVALNYKMGILDDSSPPVPTLGLVDLGGSSLQVVMEVDEPGEDDRILRSDIGNHNNIRNELLLAVSIPEFGLNDAFDRSVAMLSAQGFGDVVRHPCLSSTFRQNYTCIHCFEERRKHSRLVGDPNMELCERLVKAVALNISVSDWSTTMTFSSCNAGLSSTDGMAALGIQIKSKTNVRFHALSGFFLVYNMLDLPERASMGEIRTKAQKMCSRLWTGEKMTSEKPQSTPHYCYKVMYSVSLITDALCLGDSDIVFGPGDVSWTLGASLVQQQEQSSAKTSRETLTVMFITKCQQLFYSPLTLLLVLSIALYVVHHYQVKLPMTHRTSAAPPLVLPCYNLLKQRPL